MNNIGFYQHYADSHHHWKFKVLRRQYSWAGEGRFWALNNMIATSNQCVLDLSDEIKVLMLATDLDMSPDEFLEFVEYLVKICRLVSRSGSGITTQIVQDNFTHLDEVREQGRARQQRYRKKVSGKSEDDIVTRHKEDVTRHKTDDTRQSRDNSTYDSKSSVTDHNKDVTRYTGNVTRDSHVTIESDVSHHNKSPVTAELKKERKKEGSNSVIVESTNAHAKPAAPEGISWVSKPLPENVADIPGPVVQAIREFQHRKGNPGVMVDDVLAFWKLWKVTELQGDKFYNSQAEVYKHFANRCQQIKIPTEQTTNAKNGSSTKPKVHDAKSVAAKYGN